MTKRKSVAERFWTKVNKDGPIPAHCPELGQCWEWIAGKNGNGYGAFRGDAGMVAAHRVSYEMAHGALDKAIFVLHRCDNPACVRPDHLFTGDHEANVRDMWAKGRAYTFTHLSGERNPFAKLSDADVVAMRAQRANSGTSFRRLAKDFGVSFGHVWRIINDERRKTLDVSPSSAMD